MRNNGQTGLFVILGFILLLVFGMMLYSNSLKLNSPPLQSTEDFFLITEFVEECLEITADDALQFVASQGGYYITPDPKVLFSSVDVPLYLENYASLFPPLDAFRSSIEAYIAENVGYCLNSFEAFEQQGFAVSEGALVPKIIIADGEVFLAVSYPLTLSKGTVSQSISEFQIDLDSGLSKHYNIIEQIMTAQMKNPIGVPHSELALLASDESFFFNLIYISDGEVLYQILFEEPGPVSYNFVMRYEAPGSSDPSFFISPSPKQMMYVGEELTFKIEANDDTSVFTDRSHLFDISEDGLIVFTPSEEHAGTHYVIIEAENALGFTAVDILEFEVLI